MKAILLLIVLATTNVFAGSFETEDKAERRILELKKFCEVNTELCQARYQLKQLNQQKVSLVANLRDLKYDQSTLCLNEGMFYGDRMSPTILKAAFERVQACQRNPIKLAQLSQIAYDIEYTESDLAQIDLAIKNKAAEVAFLEVRAKK